MTLGVVPEPTFIRTIVAVSGTSKNVLKNSCMKIVQAKPVKSISGNMCTAALNPFFNVDNDFDWEEGSQG